MLQRYMAIFLLVGILSGGCGSSSNRAATETRIGSQVETRSVVALRVSGAELQGWLPAPWQLSPIASGPSKEANLLVVFLERLLGLDADGKAAAGGVEREVVLVVPAKHPQRGESASVVIRVFTGNPQALPGPYKNSKHVTILRIQTLKAGDADPASVEEVWELEDISGGKMELRFQFARARPSRSKTEPKMYSGVDPSFYRLYHVDQIADVVKSIPTGIDRVRPYELFVGIPELRKLFNGTEQLVSIETVPWYEGQVFVPRR